MIRLGIVTNGTLGLIYASHARRRPAKSLENNGAVQDFFSDVIQQLHTKTSMLLFDFLGHYKQYTD